MNSCKDFAKKKPVLLVALTVLLVFVLLEVTSLLPKDPIYLAIREVFMAIVIFVWTYIFLGKEKVSFSPNGFRYAFRVLKVYYIVLAVYFGIMMLVLVVTKSFASQLPVRVLSAIVIGGTVGIVEEFSFRGLVFGGILQKIGKSKKNIIIAAVWSGVIFGVMHVVLSFLAGEVTGWGTILTSVMKTVQTGIFGVVLAFIYIKTRNIYAVAALHGLDDLILLLMTSLKNGESIKGESYVSGDIGMLVMAYTLLTLAMVPFLIRTVKDLNEDEAVPFDDDFEPMAVKYEKRKAKKK